MTTPNTFNAEPGVKLTIQNTGTTAKALVTVKGTNWNGVAPAGTVMDVRTTHYGIAPLGMFSTTICIQDSIVTSSLSHYCQQDLQLDLERFKIVFGLLTIGQQTFPCTQN